MCKKIIVLVLFALPMYVVNPVGGAVAKSRDLEVPALDQMIERTMRTIKAAKKPLPVWAVDMAMRAYQTYKIYKTGQKVEEVRREVLAVLKVVADIKNQVGIGREMTDREFRLTRELLDTHDRRLGDLTHRVDAIERATSALRAKVKGWRQRTRKIERRFFRRGCGELHAWRNGRCVNVADNPR